jgi:putative phosphoesterase
MKIGIISDPHGNVYGLEAALNAMGEVDTLICAGDLTGYYYWANEVFELLEERNCHLICGNHDVYLLRYLGYSEPELPPEREMRIPTNQEYRRKYGLSLTLAKGTLRSKYIDWLRSAGLSCSMEVGGKRIMLVHGSPWNPFDEYIYADNNDLNRFSSVDADIIVMGHTHHPMVKDISGRLIVNPGSCGQPRDYNPEAACALLELRNHSTRLIRTAYDVKKVVDEVKKREPGNSRIADVLLRKRNVPANNHDDIPYKGV